MKQSIKAILLVCSLSACGFAGILQTLHLRHPHRPSAHAAPVAGQNRATELEIEEIHALIEAAARRHGVPIALVKGIVATESNFHCHVVSPRGAVGLMQLTQSTARQFGADASVPEQNIEAGTRYLRFLIEKYRNKRNPIKCAIAAYNAGYPAVDRYKGVPPIRETQLYVARVLAHMQEFQS